MIQDKFHNQQIEKINNGIKDAENRKDFKTMAKLQAKKVKLREN